MLQLNLSRLYPKYPEMLNAHEAKAWHCFCYCSVIICCSDLNINQNTSEVYMTPLSKQETTGLVKAVAVVAKNQQ